MARNFGWGPGCNGMKKRLDFLSQRIRPVNVALIRHNSGHSIWRQFGAFPIDQNFPRCVIYGDVGIRLKDPCFSLFFVRNTAGRQVGHAAAGESHAHIGYIYEWSEDWDADGVYTDHIGAHKI